MERLPSIDIGSLQTLLQTEAPSSAEEEVAFFVGSFNNECCTCEKDALGNSFLCLNRKDGQTIMISAHCDEIGLQVVHITESGLVRFRPVGGIDLRATAGRHVDIMSKERKVPGVICKTPIHIERIEKNERPLECSDLWIDIGCSTAEEALKMVSVGDMISFVPNFITLAGNRISSKALDNKLGVFIAVSAMRRLFSLRTPKNVTAVLTVQEEVGCKGAGVAAAQLNPLWAVCIDVGVASDTPGIQIEKYGRFVLGEGPGISFCTDTSRSLSNLACQILEAEGIPFQKTTGLSATGGTDTVRMQIAGKGVPCVLLSIPIRGMHTPTEVCDLKDVSSAIDAIVALVQHISV